MRSPKVAKSCRMLPMTAVDGGGQTIEIEGRISLHEAPLRNRDLSRGGHRRPGGGATEAPLLMETTIAPNRALSRRCGCRLAPGRPRS
jgi:hypothetical protein